MIGLTLGKKALTFGYKRAGIPGAIATGSAAAVGYVVIKRALKSNTNGSNVDTAIDTDQIKSAVDEKGVGAVTDKETLESAVDEDQLGTDLDMDDVQSDAEDEAESVDQDTDSDTTT
ncbi:hypothetical protein [Halalkalicoccus jeotgali]|uniref:Uncharacterized protein n=1 Tax=Halalkalicoccus jeotgali (strain DSM 18796 / CECT 7217 / JCM 14584 / KCTC 4019 / B3) TaxID=795797 RepID=D8JBD2_HALJB|nr:hypothetical protein [Halalkalicoccus jeotgali]ADJ16585.1 hypothetical protein HacjB3_16136 [Halalkalicoccus jeotgali B3]ELY41318.1 hypothetical protein C497_01110 [Halalkalicoccus jeotgali B3]